MPSIAIVTRTVADSLDALNVRGKRVVAALSGGVDSVVLLHALAELAPKFDVALSALHVHHGLSPYAKRWAQFCEQLCERMRVPCSVVQVKVDRRRKLGLEAAARAARYAAYSGCHADIVAL